MYSKGKENSISAKLSNFNDYMKIASKNSIIELERSEEQKGDRKRKRHILIVDDSPYNLFVMKEIMGSLENAASDVTFEIETAMNGQEALEVISLNISKDNRMIKFDLIFIDLRMPILDGFQVHYFFAYLMIDYRKT